MIAAVTGGSSGIGRDMAIELAKRGFDLILIARSKERLEEVKSEIVRFGRKAEYYIVDLSREEECKNVYEEIKEKYKDIDILINNAGFGLLGDFDKTDLETELSMIKTNIVAVHILTKLFLKDMIKKDKGTILNVASIAGFLPGPLMATYYSTKNYVYRFTESIQEELNKRKSNVKVSVLCPGPVNTNFNNVAKVKFKLKGRESKKIAQYTIKKLLKGKKVIVPGFEIKMARFFSKIVPDRILMKITYNCQSRKL